MSEIANYPATAEEYEEYCAVMGAMADEANATVRDPEPSDFDYDEPEDRYLDSSWEDQAEYGMEGCCGDF